MNKISDVSGILAVGDEAIESEILAADLFSHGGKRLSLLKGKKTESLVF